LSGRVCIKREVSQTDLTEYLKKFPDAKLRGETYVVPVKMNGGTWFKPVAHKLGGKFVVIEDQ
jgi:hypothetical protein